MLVSGVVLLKSKLLKQSNISNKKECHPLPSPILFINIILIILYLLDKKRKFNKERKEFLSVGEVYKVVITKLHVDGLKRQTIKKSICGFFFCCEKFIKGGAKPKLGHYDKKIV